MSEEIVNPQDAPAPVEQPQETPQDAPVDKPADPPEWAIRRMAEITAKRREAETEAAKWREMYERAQANSNIDSNTPAPQADIDHLARSYAESMRAQERERDKLMQIETAGRKAFGGEFDTAVANLNAAGVGGPEFLKVIAEIPDAEKVVTWLGKHDNLGEAIRISGLSPIQMGIEMTKLANKASKEMTKQVSKAPAPIQHIEGGSSSSDQVEPDPNSKDWFKWRQQTARKRR